jgi:triacylglycerol esterase/lipase EstA (alpha/beta hydrolase family)
VKGSRTVAVLALVAAVALAGPAGPAAPAAAAAGPPLRTPEDVLAAALSCTPAERPAGRESVLLVHGTGATAAENWGWNYARVLPALGFTTCTVELPNRALGDVQRSAEYVVHAVRAMAAATGRDVDVVGHSQGGLEPRWAVRWWRDVRAAVDDLVVLGTPNHGTAMANVVGAAGCTGSCLQMQVGSAFLTALNEGDETPVGVDHTSVWTVTDELVQPSWPAAAATAHLDGAWNVPVQALCPGRPVEHLGLVADAVVHDAVVDALVNPGGADPARFFTPADCLRTTFDGADPVALAPIGLAELLDGNPPPDPDWRTSEPPLAPYAR